MRINKNIHAYIYLHILKAYTFKASLSYADMTMMELKNTILWHVIGKKFKTRRTKRFIFTESVIAKYPHITYTEAKVTVEKVVKLCNVWHKWKPSINNRTNWCNPTRYWLLFVFKNLKDLPLGTYKTYQSLIVIIMNKCIKEEKILVSCSQWISTKSVLSFCDYFGNYCEVWFFIQAEQNLNTSR